MGQTCSVSDFAVPAKLESTSGFQQPLAEANVRVTVMSMSGQVIFGPASFPHSARVSDLRNRASLGPGLSVEDGVWTGPDPLNILGPDGFSVHFFSGMRELADADFLDGPEMQVSAVFGQAEPSAEQRRTCMRSQLADKGAHVLDADLDNAELFLEVADRFPLCYAELDRNLHGNKPFMLEVVRRCWQQLQYADTDVQGDRCVVMAAVEQDGRAMQFADQNLRASRDFVCTAVDKSGVALRYADASLRVDPEIAILAVRRGLLIQDLCPELLADKSFMCSACGLYESVMKQSTLRYASRELRASLEVVLSAVGRNGFDLQHAAPELRDDRAVVLRAIRTSPKALQHASIGCRADRELVNAAVVLDADALQYAADELRRDRALALRAVEQKAFALRHVDVKLRADKEVVLAAVRSWGPALKYADASLQTDKHVLAAAQSHHVSLW